MTIGIDASRANEDNKTGTEWYSYYLIRNFARLDQKNQYILYTNEPLRGGLLNLGDNFRERHLKWPLGKFWTQGRVSLEMLLKPPDVFFVPAHTIPLFHPKVTITTCHDIGFEIFPELYSQQELRYHRFTMRFAIKNAQKIITVSNFTKQEMVKIYQVDPDKITVIHNGFSRKDLYPSNDQEKIKNVLAKYKINSPYLLYIGRLEQKKNTPGLIKAYHLLKSRGLPHKLVLVGQFGQKSSEVKEVINKYKLQNDVIFTGYIAEQEKPLILSGAEIFVFPSFYEGFGIPLLEAMGCGTPVVASRAASIPEIAGEAAVYFDPHYPEDIAEQIKKVIDNAELKNQLIAKGLEQVKKYSWERCAQETLKVLSPSK